MQKKLSLPRRMIDAISEVAADPWQVMQLSIRLSAFCIMFSLVISHGWWFQENRLLRPSPLFAWAEAIPDSVNALLYGVLLLGCAVLLAMPGKRRIGFILVPVYALLVLQDQVRWQFYLYIHFFNLLVAAVAPSTVKDKHLDALRYMVIGVYLWAGIYKMNPFFMNTGFPWFVSAWFPYTALAKIIGIAVPFIEAGIGILLLIPKTRWIGQLLATVMLAVVLLSLGPYGHNEWGYIWPINVYLDVIVIFLFMDRKRSLWGKTAFRNAMPAAAIFLFVLLPALGATNYLGHHPSFKLFCCTYRAVVVNENGQQVTEKDLKPIPPHLATALHISLYPVFQPDYLVAPKGICPFLLKPEAARLKIVEDPVPFWSDEAEESLYDICSEKPRLVARKRIKP